tara:strand:- start:1386 stop:1961 length:576 start_codon:yes stop_codon:yes gene_type:complete
VREIIFGGTFDPIHKGHLLAAELALNSYNFNKVIFVPAGNPWMKSSNTVSAFHRLNMIKIAIDSNPAFFVSDVDIQRKGPTYMVDTLSDLNKKNSEDKPCILLGSDVLSDIKKWHRYKDLIQSSEFFVINRPGFNSAKSYMKNIKFNIIDGKFIEVSASEIREKIKQGSNLDLLVPEKVEDYIRKNKLYKY